MGRGCEGSRGKHVGWDVDVGNGLNVGVSIIIGDRVVGDEAE